MRPIFFILSFWICISSQAQHPPVTPFTGMDLSWINGQSRIKNQVLIHQDTVSELTLVGNVFIDGYVNHSFQNPIDHTHNTSATIGRHSEFTLNLASIGMEASYKRAIGRLSLQTGAMLDIVQETDASINRGRNGGGRHLKYIREASAGYQLHIDHGMNIEMGIFSSFVGLESYMLQDNWNYQHAFISDFTPFYFQGLRIQYFPAWNLRQELWIVNGWQSYNTFSSVPTLGSSTCWRPNENIQLIANFYLGRDTKDPDTLGNQSGRIRFHHDHSAVWRYKHKPQSRGVTQCAFSLNNHYGFQHATSPGTEIAIDEHFMIGSSLTHRIWMNDDQMAFATRVDFLHNGGAYLAFTPSPVAPNAYSDLYRENPNQVLKLFQFTATLDLMPNDVFTFRFEYGYRKSNIPYFAGHGGTTSPSGWTDGPNTQLPWQPDLVMEEHRISVSVNFRL